jgi:putative ABC transport system permease protein
VSPASFIWANLRRRPIDLLLTLLASTCAFTLYGLAMGAVENIQRMATNAHIAMGDGPLMSAAAISAVGFALIFLLTANATMQSVRLRMTEFGVMKAIGFSHQRIILLVMGETMMPWLAGAVLGLSAAWPLLPYLVAVLPFPAAFPGLAYSPTTLAGAILLAILLGGGSAALPALRIIRLDAVEALADRRGVKLASGWEGVAVSTSRVSPSSEAPGRKSWQNLPQVNPRLLRQVFIVMRIGLATLRHRLKGAFAVVAALAVITIVMNPLLILMDSFKAMMASQGSSTHVMVTQPQVRMWRDGQLPVAWTDIIKHAPGVARTPDGIPIAEARSFLQACEHPEGPPGDRGTCVMLYGLEPAGLPLRPKFQLVAGRINRPGTHEIIMSARLAAQHGIKVGTQLRLNDQEWEVSGLFLSYSFWIQGDTFGDAAIVRAATSHPDYDSFVVAQLTSPDALETFRAALQAHPELKVSVARENDFYNDFASSATAGWLVIIYVVGGVISIGAGAGIFHLMQVTVEERRMEMAVLRAIGFGETAVATSIVLEAMMLASFGALLGMLPLWFWYNGTLYRDSVLVNVEPGRLAMAVSWSLGIALLGALSPALGAARMEVAEALRK